ncbi:MAG: hypothetical protein ACPK7O_03185 [Methanobacterium sp.]
MEDKKCRCLKCCFKKYWITGLVISVILGVLNSVIGMLSNFLIGLQAQMPPLIYGIMMLVATIIFIATVPWIFGRLIKWSYESFLR